MKQILKKEGYKVEIALDGEGAIQKINKNVFDLILIDILMPESGYDLLRLLREKLGHKIRIEYVTIVPKQDVKMKDIDGIIQKPFSNERLLEEVKKLVI